MKNIFNKGVNWAAILLILISVQQMVSAATLTSVKDWVLFGLGVLIIILRTYFVDEIKKEVKDAEDED